MAQQNNSFPVSDRPCRAASTEGHLREILDSPMGSTPFRTATKPARCNRLSPSLASETAQAHARPSGSLRLTVHAASDHVRVAEPVTPILRPHDPPHLETLASSPAAGANQQSYRFNKRQGNTKDIRR